jgi:hypothetical protein
MKNKVVSRGSEGGIDRESRSYVVKIGQGGDGIIKKKHKKSGSKKDE